MKTITILACVAPVAMATRNAAELAYALPKGLSAETSDCEFPGNFTIENLSTAGYVEGNFTKITNVDFTFVDSESNLTTTCEMSPNSTNLSPGGLYANYQCQSSLLTFSWGNTTATGMNYKLAVSEDICNRTYEVSGSWIPEFTCQNSTTAQGVECAPASASNVEAFSGINPIIN